jgi:chorismate mutase
MENEIIAGPCSLESKEQFEKTLVGLLNNGINHIRAGIWKPRTKPGGFEGLGEAGLKIINECAKVYNFKSYTEVAEPEHVYLAEKYGIDVFWIGSRTTGNPFSVQAIANSIKNKNKEILIKNPMNYDVHLWAGAVLRFQKMGFKNISVIFRGFNQASAYRNEPIFGAIDELNSILGYNIPVVIDISHIAGSRSLLSQVAAKSLNLGYNNFMIESHFNPAIALTDSEQQVVPDAVKPLLTENDLLAYERTTIDYIDDKIVSLLDQRMESVKTIGRIKEKLKFPTYDAERAIEVLGKYHNYKCVYSAIHDQAVLLQNETRSL